MEIIKSPWEDFPLTRSRACEAKEQMQKLVGATKSVLDSPYFFGDDLNYGCLFFSLKHGICWSKTENMKYLMDHVTEHLLIKVLKLGIMDHQWDHQHFWSWTLNVDWDSIRPKDFQAKLTKLHGFVEWLCCFQTGNWNPPQWRRVEFGEFILIVALTKMKEHCNCWWGITVLLGVCSLQQITVGKGNQQICLIHPTSPSLWIRFAEVLCLNLPWNEHISHLIFLV